MADTRRRGGGGDTEAAAPSVWGRGKHSPRVLPSDAVQMAGLPEWGKVAAKMGRVDQKRATSEAEKDGVSRKPVDDFAPKPNAELNKKISFWRGDITTLGGDAIVNAANTSLLGGGGIDGAIHAAAGIELYKECAMLNGCERGKAKITKGYRLPVKHVIHTVGPLGENPKLLSQCYDSCLAFVNTHHLRTIALCGISTGVYGYPPEKAAHIALMTVRRWLERGKNASKVDRIVFVTFTKRETRIYEHLADVYFPPDEASFYADTDDEDGEVAQLDSGDFGDDDKVALVAASVADKLALGEKEAAPQPRLEEGKPAEGQKDSTRRQNEGKEEREMENEGRAAEAEKGEKKEETAAREETVGVVGDAAAVAALSKAQRKKRNKQLRAAEARLKQEQDGKAAPPAAAAVNK